MPRIRTCFLLCAATLVGALPLLNAGPQDDAANRKEVLLAVQRALAQGREYVKAGHYKAAVDVLERELGDFNVFENRDYRRALSDAYIGYVGELKRSNQADEAAVYQRRLSAIDPGAVLELKGPVAKPVAATNPAPKSLLPPPPSVTAAAPDTKGVIARGQANDKDDKGDPFEEANSRGAPDVQDLLERAEREYDAAHYEAAGRLFEQAERAQKGVTAAARERWAYCKLSRVVNALNGPSAAPPQELEREVRLALSMAPKLDGVGRDLLRRIQERQGSAALGTGAPTYPTAERAADTPVAVKHTPRQGNGWALAETAHFRIFHVQSRDVAERAAQVAETARLTSARKWFGDALPPWPTRCDVYLHSTADAYAQATQQSPRCPGHSTMPMEGDRVISRRIDVHCDDPNMCIGVLPHEVTHVVLAGRFPAALPRWADEGMAVLSEPRDRVERHLRNLPMHAEQRQLFHIGQLMMFDKSYPDPQLIGPFYAQSVSLVEYLSQLKGPQAFAQFLAEGMRGNYEAALRKHYGIQSLQDLDAAWQRHAFGDGMAAQR